MAKLKTALLVVAMSLLSVGPVRSNETPANFREINITSDSEPGWLPSAELSDAAEHDARAYLTARDSGEIAKAYAMLADINRANMPYERYSGDQTAIHDKLGDVIERRFLKVTWTKNPRNAPALGIYVAIDLAGRFTKADRFCGYMILYQPLSGKPFGVMREEENFIENAQADSIAKTHGPAEVEKVWTQLSSHCPNYPGVNARP
ncbi:MAG: DUF4019 domain-containing protein [Alphaproteobacteria bacterium]|nr:DUF4019 domain-containing protein [Alphaproteobacteria bacterium]